MSLDLLTHGAYSNGRLQFPTATGSLPEESRQPIEVVPLDQFLAGIDRIDLIKIDIEGAEPLAWQGMETLLARHRPIVLTEYFPDLIRITSQTDPGNYLQMMQHTGYRLYLVGRKGALSTAPLSTEEIVQIHRESGKTHLDLLALPV